MPNDNNKHKIQIFEGQKVRTVWNEDEQQCYFAIIDIPSKKAEPFKQWMAQVASDRPTRCRIPNSTPN